MSGLDHYPLWKGPPMEGSPPACLPALLRIKRLKRGTEEEKEFV